jgi:hypothetical protein
MALDIIVLSYADEINPSWKEISSVFPAAKQLSLSSDDLFKKMLNLINTSQFWLVFPNIEVTNQELDFQPDDVEKRIINLFKAENSEEFSVAFVSRMYLMRLVTQKKLVSIFDLFSQDVKEHDERKGIDLNRLNITEFIQFDFDVLNTENYLDLLLTKIKTKFIWLIFPNMIVEKEDLVFIPNAYERSVINLFKAENSDEYSAAYVSTQLLIDKIRQKKIKSIFDLFSQDVKIQNKKKGTDLNRLNITEFIQFGFIESDDENIVNLQSENYLDAVLDKIKTKFIWLIFPNMDVNKDELMFIPDAYERSVINLFKAENADEYSAAYVSKTYLAKLINEKKIKSIFDLFSQEVKEQNERKGYAYLDKLNTNLDIILLSYFEPNAQDKFNALQSKFGERVKWVKNVKGIINAHIQAAQISSTYSFYVIDADAEILDSFNFDFQKLNNSEYNAVFVWKSRNILNGLEYGYGGVKLFNKFHFKNSSRFTNGNIIDFTTSLGGIELVDEVACITKFNTSALTTWRSAFRECAKLSSSIISSSNANRNEELLKTWTTVANGDFSKYCIHGALLGQKFGEDNKNDKEILNKINDFEWLESEFRSYFGF